MAGIKLAPRRAGRLLRCGGPGRADNLVVTSSGSSARCPGTEPGSLKVTPFDEYPAKGRATGGVRATGSCAARTPSSWPGWVRRPRVRRPPTASRWSCPRPPASGTAPAPRPRRRSRRWPARCPARWWSRSDAPAGARSGRCARGRRPRPGRPVFRLCPRHRPRRPVVRSRRPVLRLCRLRLCRPCRPHCCRQHRHGHSRPDACSVLSEQAGISAFGSASEARFWLAVEQSGPWGRDALSQSHLDATLGAALAAACQDAGGRLLLIRRPGQHADAHHPTSRRVLVAGGLSGPRRGCSPVTSPTPRSCWVCRSTRSRQATRARRWPPCRRWRARANRPCWCVRTPGATSAAPYAAGPSRSRRPRRGRGRCGSARTPAATASPPPPWCCRTARRGPGSAPSWPSRPRRARPTAGCRRRCSARCTTAAAASWSPTRPGRGVLRPPPDRRGGPDRALRRGRRRPAPGADRWSCTVTHRDGRSWDVLATRASGHGERPDSCGKAPVPILAVGLHRPPDGRTGPPRSGPWRGLSGRRRRSPASRATRRRRPPPTGRSCGRRTSAAPRRRSTVLWSLPASVSAWSNAAFSCGEVARSAPATSSSSGAVICVDHVGCRRGPAVEAHAPGRAEVGRGEPPGVAPEHAEAQGEHRVVAARSAAGRRAARASASTCSGVSACACGR